MHLLGIDIDRLSRTELLAHCGRWLSEESGFHRIATVNPEFLLLAQEDVVFHQALEAADLRIVDGFGIVLAAWIHGTHLERFPGADLLENLLQRANEKRLAVFFAVRQDGLCSFEEVRAALKQRYPDIEVGGADIDPQFFSDTEKKECEKYTLLFSNFGAPEQEIFLESFRTEPGNIRIAVGVGGALDYLTGHIARAPRILRRLGLEWLWRLFYQPRRIGRIWNATGVFFWKILFEKKKKTTA